MDPRRRSQLCLFKTPSVSEAALCKQPDEPPSIQPNAILKYYATLGVTIGTPLPEIRSAFLKLARENNPSEDSHKERFMELTEAYQIIKKALQGSYSEACNFYSRLNRVFDKVFAITEPESTLEEGKLSTASCKSL